MTKEEAILEIDQTQDDYINALYSLIFSADYNSIKMIISLHLLELARPK